MNKVFKLEGVKIYDTENDERKFTGYASTFGNLDRVGDVVDFGAFQKAWAYTKAMALCPLCFCTTTLNVPQDAGLQ